MKLIIQIPCFNEEATLPQTVADLPREVEGFDVVEWLVIDDGSTDRTVEVARRTRRRPRDLPRPQPWAGRGVHHRARRVRSAAAPTSSSTPTPTTSTDGSSIPDLVAPVLSGAAQMVVGERPIESIDDFSRSKKWFQRIGSAVVRRFSGTDVRDAASGFRAYSRDAAMQVQVFGRYTYTMETIIQAGWNGVTVASVPIEVNPKTRESRLVKSVPRYIMRSAQTIVRSFALYKPFRFFFAIGAVPFVIGLVLLVRWLLLYAFEADYTSRVPSLLAGIGLMLLAVQVWSVAFLADLLQLEPTDARRAAAAQQTVGVRRRRGAAVE